MDLEFRLKAFQQLDIAELYSIMQLRAEVFVVEQDCPYQDLDGKDQKCHHLMLWKGPELVGYTRLVSPGVSYSEISIGRVITAKSIRGTGAGRKLMDRSIEESQKVFGKGNIRISAQTYALKFYSSLGFQPEGEVYDEDGIEHISMVWSA